LVPQELARLGVGTKPAPSASIKAGGKARASGNDKKQP
jgi:hypothetical protein